MTDDTTTNTSPRMPPITVTYQELVTIRTQLVELNAKFAATLALQGRVDGLEKRMSAVETFLAGRTGENKVWNTILSFGAGVVSFFSAAFFRSVMPNTNASRPSLQVAPRLVLIAMSLGKSLSSFGS